MKKDKHEQELDSDATLNLFKQLPELQQAHCKIRDPVEVGRLIDELVRGGPERLQLVSDFDNTITKQCTADGKRVPTSFGMLHACKSLPLHFMNESQRLFEKYHPIEVNPHLPISEKVAHMIDWWSQTSALLCGYAFDKSEIDEIASEYKDDLRDRTHELFDKLCALDIPVLVFSAGLGDSIVSVLRNANLMLPNVKVVSNFLQYKNGLLDGFKLPLIHTFNKNETALDEHEYYDLVHTRDHIIVMGDSLGDSGMANGVPKSSQIIKIGFLFDHVDEYLEEYMNTFDIVLINDQTMDIPLKLISLIEAKHQQIKD